MKICLIGFMGTGKSSVGALLSSRLKIPLYETDEIILQNSSLSSINEIFAQEGEQGFRYRESRVLGQMVAIPCGVIATGGGVVVTPSNHAVLRQIKGDIFYLQTSFSILTARLVTDQSRPLFRNKEHALELYRSREALYSQLANYTINTDSLSIAEVAESIILEGAVES